MGVDDIPKDELAEYLSADLKATQELSDRLYTKLNSTECHLWNLLSSQTKYV